MKSDLAWCLNQAKGIRLIKPNENLTGVYLRKSRSALNMLQAALAKKEFEWVLDTSYYAKYFAVYALFMKTGIKCEIHDCTLAALRKLFVGIVPTTLCDELERSKDLRIGALYYNKEFAKKEILARADAAPGFCLSVEQLMATVSERDIKRVREGARVLGKTLTA